jgi:hypothetical protein
MPLVLDKRGTERDLQPTVTVHTSTHSPTHQVLPSLRPAGFGVGAGNEDLTTSPTATSAATGVELNTNASAQGRSTLSAGSQQPLRRHESDGRSAAVARQPNDSRRALAFNRLARQAPLPHRIPIS